jgi:ring-1,2-phenylacetyl-CoA epoxidase subunit PaaE
MPFYPLEVSKAVKDTRDSIVVTLLVPDHLKELFRFQPGQNLTVRTHIDGEEVRRSYSICSAVHDGNLRIGIKKVIGGHFSTWANDCLRKGSTLEVMPPVGRFTLDLDASHENNYLAIAVGSGITPVLSIIKSTLVAEPKSSFTLFYGNRASGTVMFREELAELKDLYLDRFCLVHVLSREHQDLDLLNGRITGAKALELAKRWAPLDRIHSIYLCGPEPMLKEIQESFKQVNYPSDRIKFELFATQQLGNRKSSTLVSEAKSNPCDVTIVLDGVTHHYTLEQGKETILEAGLRNGLDLRYSCKGGVCSTCRGKLLEGEVEMDTNFALEDYEVARGFILTCQSFPITPHVVVDFDQP